MVHAVYTDKDIFLRELISNASDACDKLRYEAIGKPELWVTKRTETRHPLRPDKERALSPSRTTASAWTTRRAGRQSWHYRHGPALANSSTSSGRPPEGASLIGQFGVGFYSAFMVADEIEVTSRKAGSSEVNVWRSNGADGFTIAPADPERAAAFKRGTEIRLKLKEDAKSYLEPHEIERIVRTYSDHILFPVELVEDSKEPRQVNTASALWQRSKSEVKPEDYKEVYQSITGHFDEPALTLHYKAEGRQAYAVLLFVPQMRPFDLYDPSRKGRVKLYVRRVYITDDADLLPTYLRFVRGVVDSEDVPLNISREMLQNNPLVAQIRKALTGRVISELESTASKDALAYEKLWETFGSVLKEETLRGLRTPRCADEARTLPLHGR